MKLILGIVIGLTVATLWPQSPEFIREQINTAAGWVHEKTQSKPWRVEMIDGDALKEALTLD